MFGRRREKAPKPAPEWNRQKMLALLIGAGAVCLVLVLGLVLAVVYALKPDQAAAQNGGGGGASFASPHGGGGDAGAGGTGVDPRDALADKAMEQVDDDASHPAAMTTSLDTGPPIVLPAATRVGAAGVPTGFPHTPQGAMAQLAVIDQVALQSGSIATAGNVITHWSLPGGPTRDNWSTEQALIRLFTSAQTAGSAQLALVLTPLMGQVKGSVGTDFVVPCIDFELDVTLSSTARGAVADCQRMVWTSDALGGRWVIGAGSEPAEAPAVWPGTDLAFAVGYTYLQLEPRHG